MATQTKVIGPISAYAIAVQEGYTGSKSEWAAEIGNAQENAQIAQDAAERVQNLTESLPDDFTDTIANFAPTYSTDSTYAVGAYVIHYGSLYRCTTKITTAEAWTPAHWVQVNVGGEVSDLKSACGDGYYTPLLRIDGFNVSQSVQVYDVDWHAGDTIRVDYATDNPGKYLTIVAEHNGTNTDYFVNTTAAEASGSVTITLTSDAERVKVFASLTNQYRYVDIAFYKKHSTSELEESLVQIASGVKVYEERVGDEYVSLWADHYSLTNVRLFDVDFHAGDVIRLEFRTNIGGGNLAVATSDADGNTKEVIVNTVNRLASGQRTVTLTQDAPKLKLYVTYPENGDPVDIKVSKKITDDLTLTERAYQNAESIDTALTRIESSESSIQENTAQLETLEEAVGDIYWQEVKRIDGYAVRAATELFDVDFAAGDVIKLNYTTNDPGKHLTVVTFVNDTNTDYFVQTSSRAASGEMIVPITADATKLKVFATFTAGLSDAHVDLVFTRRCTIADLNNTLLAQAAENKSLSRLNQIDNEYIENSIPYEILGESMLSSNNAYNQNPFLGIVMLDNNYKYFSVANIKRIIDAMAAVHLNCLELGFGGSGRGLGFALNNMQFTVRGKTYDMSNCISTSSGKYLTESDMEEIISYANGKGIEIMPSFNVISHASAILAKNPELWYRGAYDHSLNIDSDDAIDFAVGLAEMYGKWFAYHGCKNWNLCADEFSIDWSTLQASGDYHYAEAINRVAYALSRYRFTLHCWNDPICANESVVPFINRQLVVHYWAKKKAGYASLPAIIADGHPVINANQSIYWVANAKTQVTEQQIRAFDITRFAGGYTYANPAGASFCIWIGNLENPPVDDDGLAITNEVLPLITAFGETISGQHD